MSEEKTIKEILGQLAGAASLCWDKPSLGVFDSVRAIQFVEEAYKEIEGILSKERAKVKELERQNKIMREALTPFANALKWYKDEDLLKSNEWCPRFYGIDFVKARQALAEAGKGDV